MIIWIHTGEQTMRALLDIRTFILALILTVIGVGYTVANVVVITLDGDPASLDPATVLRGNGVFDATTGSIDVGTGIGASSAPLATIGPLEISGWCDRTSNEVGGQVGNLGTDQVQIWVQDLAATSPKVAESELDQFDGLASERDQQPRIVSWIGSTAGGREFSVDLAMKIVQNANGTATCGYEARTFLAD
jgi:hypothetical protein